MVVEYLNPDQGKLSGDMRIAFIQHGDHRAALQTIASGAKEPYFGMRYSVETMEAFCGANPKLIISLNPVTGAYRTQNGNSTYLGYVPPTKWWKIPGTASLRSLLLAKRIIGELQRFKPTGVVIRTPGLLGLELLKYTSAHQISTLVLFANSFYATDPRSERLNRKLADLCNQASVYLVGNHRQVSTQSMVDCGVNPNKAVAYDWPGARHPKDYGIKTLNPAKSMVMVYAATMVESKGIGDLITAVGLLGKQGIKVELRAFGTGPDEAAMKDLAQRVAPGQVTFPGRVDNEVLFQALRECTLACVPTRPEWQEGGSLILTEALASRTPVVLSDQPMFAQTFKDKEGVRFFQAANPESLAATLRAVVEDSSTYSLLSETTLEAFGRAECKTTFGDLLLRWQAKLLAHPQ